MSINVAKELARLEQMTVTELRDRWTEVYGEPTRSGNKPYLVKRIIWRMQALEEGDLSERARHLAMALARDADVRLRPPPEGSIPIQAAIPAVRMVTRRLAPAHRGGLPMAGAILTRDYRGRKLHVKVVEGGFEFEGEVHRSLTAVAHAITGTHWNGRLFFGLTKTPRKERTK